ELGSKAPENYRLCTKYEKLDAREARSYFCMLHAVACHYSSSAWIHWQLRH
ncbi:hypothetical protein KI387_017205, partial [Taxus chinensis]